ncbi:uncharacterized protein CTHT_0065330 [Thermochaetoides thermophila DSM 1495]|uniref:Uncharacterized protein n=1 Tax=Chaetomium thermophilum (strain DSM 1495 / CBS 144.50 / IMI 039719) TaxID=759272 RepID=G0SG77_CHATD|nr:hypothetical protein CTHT_0065330 [Thermochaetoides thermophila DSM 1495]EGS17216.1 hypothetical protein CTHT_0065330 [Thermochaetoides thermophila DSM 1495]
MSYEWQAASPTADPHYARGRADPMIDHQYSGQNNDVYYGHSRTRTTSSNIFPIMPPPMPSYPPPSNSNSNGYNNGYNSYNNNYDNNYNNNNNSSSSIRSSNYNNYMPPPQTSPLPPLQPQSHQQMHHQQHHYLNQPQGAPAIHQRRSPSVNTFSTVSSNGASGGGMAPPAAYRTSPVFDLRRSNGNGNSGSGSPHPSQGLSYVALLRKQKATVWCERAQFEDPRLLAQQRAAKMRAHREVEALVAGTASGRTLTGLSIGAGGGKMKIRHHGKTTVMGYFPGGNINGVSGVPVRLSATEVEGEDSEEEDRYHRRNSAASGGRRNMTMTGTYRSGGARWSPADGPSRRGSVVEQGTDSNNNNNNNSAGNTTPGADAGGNNDTGGSGSKANSFASGSSALAAERLDSVPELASNTSGLAGNSAKHAVLTREKSVKSIDELRRRGSVDERTMTLTHGRLYIANPD